MRAAFGSLLLVLALAPQERATAESAHFNYILHCQGCHLVDGRETAGKIPALIRAGRFLSVEGGRAFLVQVPGVALSIIDDNELADLVNWLLSEFSAEDLPSDFEPYTAEEVGRYRHDPLVDVELVREHLLAAVEKLQK